jgi:hypothetical protein
MKNEHEGFLHRHPGKETELKVDPDHVLVDREEWEKIRTYVCSQSKSMRRRYGLIKLEAKNDC